MRASGIKEVKIRPEDSSGKMLNNECYNKIMKVEKKKREKISNSETNKLRGKENNLSLFILLSIPFPNTEDNHTNKTRKHESPIQHDDEAILEKEEDCIVSFRKGRFTNTNLVLQASIRFHRSD